MKKLLLVTSFMLLAVILVGCVDKTTTTTTQTTTTTTTTTSQTPTDNDPVISGVDDVTIEKNSVFVPLQGVTATDVEDGDLTSAIQYSGNVNPNAVGTYTATYTVTDSDGNVTVEERTVTVIFTDTAAPLITGTANKTIYVGESFNPITGVSATDTVDGSVDVTYTGSVNVWAEGSYTLTYTASDESGNDATATRVITVTFGDFVFGDEVNIPQANFTTLDGVMSSPAISGGVINEAMADFTYLKVVISGTATTAGNISVALGTAVSNLTDLAFSTTSAEYTLYFVLTEALVDAVLTIDTNDLTIDALTVDYSFAEVRDMVAPTLNVPSTDAAHAVGKSLAELEATLRSQVTAVDNIDGNLTSSIVIEWGTLDINVVGEHVVTYSVTDAGGNETTAERTVIIGNLVNAGVLTDPTFQNLGDGLWNEKSNNGEADVVYDATEQTMTITVTKLGDWLSAAGAYYKESSANLEVDQWYMFTFTVKTTIDRKMGFRMGLVTDQANDWIDDFDGRNNIFLDINGEYQTFNFYFKLDSLVSSNGSTEFTIELNLGNKDYSNIGLNGVTTFKDVAMYKVVTEFAPPTYVEHVGANLPVKFTEGDTAPNWADYVSFYDMSNALLTPTIDATAVNMAVAGSYDVIFTATDSRENSTSFTLTITVQTSANADVTGPVITPKDGVPTTLDQFTNISVDLTQLVTVLDAVDGEITVLPEMVDDGGLNFNVAGIYTVTYTVYDLSGNITTLEVDVTIVDKQGPTITVGDFVINVGDAFDGLQGLSVTDNVDGLIANSSVVITGLDAFTVDGIATTAGSFEITYTVQDALGNVGTKTVTVTVTDIIWDEDSRTPLGTQDEGPTHSTMVYDALEEAYVISNIDVNVDPWDHARLVYYFNANTELVFGRTYKFEIRVKADQATDLYFRIGSTLWVDPWIDNFDGGLATVSITNEYVTYQVVFTVDKPMVNGNAKFQFMYGYLPTDATNNIYIKYFDLIEEQQPIVESVVDLATGSTITGSISNSTIAYDAVEDAYLITDIPAYTYDWMVGRVTNMFDNTVLTFGETYRVKVVAKATTATDLKVRIGTTLGADPWIDNFEGGVSRFGITTEYVTYYVYFTVDKESFVSANSAKMEFDYGFLSDTENTIYIKDFAIEHVYYPLVEGVDYLSVDGFDYADEAALELAWKNRINGTNQTGDAPLLSFETLNGGLVLELPAVANEGWFLARRMAGLASLGVTDDFKTLAFYVTNNTNVTSMGVWLYWNGTQNNFPVTLPAIGESGWVTINVQSTSGALPTAITDIAFGFNNWSASPVTGSITVYELIAVKEASAVLKYPVEIQLPPNDAPVISMSDADKAAIAGMTLKAGESIEALLPSLLSMIQINDTEDGIIAVTEAMLNLGTLDLVNPLMGTYELVVNASDSQGLAANSLTIKLSIVSILNDFESYVVDTVFSNTAKGDFTSLYGIRVGGSAWNSTATVVAVEENNVLSQNYAYAGSGTNGIRLLISKATLEAAGAEYIGIFMKTSNPLSSSAIFQTFQYATSISGGFAQVTSYGTVSYTDEGTYLWIKVADLATDVASVSFMINVPNSDSGTLTLDNIIIK